MKERNFREKSYSEQLASILYSHLASEADQRDMNAIAQRQGKKPPAQQPILDDHKRGYMSPLGGQAVRSK